MDNNWQQILRANGYPITAVTLDFECYFDKGYCMGKGKDSLSIVEYVLDPRFEFTGLGLFVSNQPFDDEENCAFLCPGNIEFKIETLQKEYGKNLERCTIVGQNLMFDCMILREKFGIIPKYTIDTLNLARHEDSRRPNKLEKLCEYYDVGIQKGDTKQFKGLRWDNMSPTQQRNMAEYCRGDIISTTRLFRLLFPLLTNPAIELPLQQHTLEMYLRLRLAFDFDLANNLIIQMGNELDNILEKVMWIWDYADKNHKDLIDVIRSAKFVKALADVLLKGESVPMKMGKRGNIPALAQTDEAFQYLLKHPDQKVQELAQARLAAKSWPTWIKRLGSIIAQAKLRDGKLGIPLLYYKAHTGRWAGTQNINMHNLPGRGRAGEGTHPLLQKIRNCVIAPPGYILGIVDLAQIEARDLAWYAGQDDLLEGFKNGEDVYSEFATGLFRSPVRKARKTDPIEIQGFLTIRRGFGKDAILGCGYGMGSGKFYDRCLSNNDLKPSFDCGDFDYAFIEGLIKTYRKQFSKIPEFWNKVEKAFRWVTKYPHEKAKVGSLIFYNDNGVVNIQLPSGRCLKYPQARIMKDRYNGTIKYQHGYLWGGSITENIIQASSRDIFAEGILTVEKAGYPIVLHSHDEIVCLFKKKTAEKDLEKVIEIVCRNPLWCKDLPLAAEGELSAYYKK